MSAPAGRPRVAWVDLRGAGEGNAALVEAAVHHGLDGVLDDEPASLATMPPTIARMAVAADADAMERLSEHADVILVPPALLEGAASAGGLPELGAWLEVRDAATVELACSAARSGRWTLLRFRDPTKIPLEIVLATSDRVGARTVSVVDDLEEARIVFGVLEKGPQGVALAAGSADEVQRLSELRQPWTVPLALQELRVTRVRNLGMGDRACVDTCSFFAPDEGLLVGSYSRGMILVCSETHPLPYMPTRPFRVNAGAVHSYVLTGPERTNYLSELESGHQVLAVDTAGGTRPLTVGRVKIERRPLIGVDATAPDGQDLGVVLQNDWHVRVLGPDGSVHNVTELRPGDALVGHVLEVPRHVGIAVSEFCLEK